MKIPRGLKLASNTLLVLSATVIILPLALALGTSLHLHKSLFDETGGGAYLWLLIPAIPSAAILLFFAFITERLSRSNSQHPK